MSETERLKGTVALITGASSGIGEATARALAGAGAKVAIVARRQERLEVIANELRERGSEVHVVVADITDAKAAEKAVDETVHALGRLDTLVNNAGVMLLGPIEEAPLEEWERMVQLNVLALMYMTHAAIPHLLQSANKAPRHVADIVNVSSVAGRIVRAGTGAYNLTKHGVGAFTESLRQEFTKRHLRCSVIEPGFVKTELQSHVRPEILEQLMKTLGPSAPLEADDIADAIHYIVTRKRHVAINEVLIRPTDQDR